MVAEDYTLNHSILIEVHINTQEDLFYHVKRQMTGCKNIEDALIDFMFKRKFNASSGLSQIANTFNGNINVLSYSAGKRDRGKRHPREEGAKPLDSIEQGAKPSVRWKVEKRYARKTFSKELKTCQRC